MDLAPGTRIGGYVLQERIGRGGVGTVYRAYHAGLDRLAAIKILPERLLSDPTFRQRFQREARIAASLSHPSILAVYDFGECNGLPYLAMEYVGGGTLTDLLGEPLPLDRVLTLATPLANALDYAHKRGVLHRDVKPANILLRTDGKPVLADFGLANILTSQSGLTPAGSILGTPHYVAPEQVQAHPLDPRADVYSFAVMLFEMLTGVVPFENDTAAAILIAHVTQPPPSLLRLNPVLPARVETILHKALAKDPAERYARTSDLVRALRMAQAETILARAQPRESSPTTVQLPVHPAAHDALPRGDPAGESSAPHLPNWPAPADRSPSPPLSPLPTWGTQRATSPTPPILPQQAEGIPSSPTQANQQKLLVVAAAAAAGGLCVGVLLMTIVLLMTR